MDQSIGRTGGTLSNGVAAAPRHPRQHVVSHAVTDLGLVGALVAFGVLPNLARRAQRKTGWHQQRHGTNHTCPSGYASARVGQCVKERYRTMRSYKRKESIRNVSSLIGWVRMKGADYNLGELVAQ